VRARGLQDFGPEPVLVGRLPSAGEGSWKRLLLSIFIPSSPPRRLRVRTKPSHRRTTGFARPVVNTRYWVLVLVY